jgi:hypothetical protein
VPGTIICNFSPIGAAFRGTSCSPNFTGETLTDLLGWPPLIRRSQTLGVFPGKFPRRLWGLRQLNHRPLGYEPDRSLGKKTPLSVDSCPKSLGRDSSLELRGSTGVLAYCFLTCSLFRTTLRLLLQLVGLPLRLIGLCPFHCHVRMVSQARPDS